MIHGCRNSGSDITVVRIHFRSTTTCLPRANYDESSTSKAPTQLLNENVKAFVCCLSAVISLGTENVFSAKV